MGIEPSSCNKLVISITKIDQFIQFCLILIGCCDQKVTPDGLGIALNLQSGKKKKDAK
jgi:hypothetical protein